MQISIIQAILIGTLYYLTNNGVPWLTGLAVFPYASRSVRERLSD